jgi:hypothetical protein
VGGGRGAEVQFKCDRRKVNLKRRTFSLNQFQLNRSARTFISHREEFSEFTFEAQANTVFY